MGNLLGLIASGYALEDFHITLTIQLLQARTDARKDDSPRYSPSASVKYSFIGLAM